MSIGTRRQYKRRILLINKKIQLGILAYGACTAIITTIFNYVIFRLLQLETPDLVVTIAFSSYLACLLGLMLLVLYTSHRVVGPIYRLTNHARQAVTDRAYRPVKLREHDHFHDFAELYNELILRLDEHEKRE